MSQAPIPIKLQSVLLFFEQGLDRKNAAQTAAWFDAVSQGPVTVQVSLHSSSVKPKRTRQFWYGMGECFVALRKLRDDNNIPLATFVFLLTKTQNENNWYAVRDSQQMWNGFVHFGDFTWVTSAPGSVIAAHYTLKLIFNTLLEQAEVPLEKMQHQVARGCFFDFCGNKLELSIKLRTADICGDCMQIFQSACIPDALLKQTAAIMEGSRKLAINTGQFLEDEASFNDWPFPVAITRHKIVQALNPLLRFMLLLDHFDSLVRYFYLAHEVEAGRKPAQVDKPSLGWWVDQLAASLKGQAHFRDVVRIAAQEKVVSLRNEKRGHAWMSVNEESYREDADTLEKTLTRIEEELRPFFEKHRLVIPRHIQLIGGTWVVDGDNLVGSHILHPPFRLEFEQDPRSIGLTGQHDVFSD